MTVGEAAALLQVSPAAVRKRARRGQLPGAVVRGRDWHVPASAVAAALARRSQPTTAAERTAVA
ncbi:helix-turn-helix domain-containing protein [Blastococcus carthaginiensis]|uniref:helix-turn-helix domain-containing protein n=1 Tax=Blastococcus carthaginiensis TaxID=3050034 RepID=UPI003872D412